MTDIAIQVEGLSKRYWLGQGIGQGDLRDFIANTARSAIKAVTGRGGKTSLEEREFWAVRDVSFDVRQGEVLGVIGRNGAGKSTLLKLLTRITDPTHGHATIRGRVGSLLEVGTGFHPELSGRENVYLNGAILGMNRREIGEAFDEIVEFSEIGKFLDTPVKRYSSGMYVRLAFAVAAHLKPEILIVDEVLAVGDAAFQQKCIGKMGDVAKQGRTVLLVSHNMASIQALCHRAIYLIDGQIDYEGDTQEAIRRYLQRHNPDSDMAICERTDREGSGEMLLHDVAFIDPLGRTMPALQSGDDVTIRFELKATQPIQSPMVLFSIVDRDGIVIAHFNNEIRKTDLGTVQNEAAIDCRIPKLPLKPGRYFLNVSVTNSHRETLDRLEQACGFDVIEGDFFGSGHPTFNSKAIVLVDHDWSVAASTPTGN